MQRCTLMSRGETMAASNFTLRRLSLSLLLGASLSVVACDDTSTDDAPLATGAQRLLEGDPAAPGLPGMPGTAVTPGNPGTPAVPGVVTPPAADPGLPMETLEQVPVDARSGRRIDVRLSPELLERQRSMVPVTHHQHPEFGLGSAGDPAGSVELLHMRTERTRYLLMPDESIVARTHQVPVHATMDGFMVHAAPRFVARSGGRVGIEGPWLQGEVGARLQDGIRLVDPTGVGVDIPMLNEVALVAELADGRTVPLPLSTARLQQQSQERLTWQAAQGLTMWLQTYLEGVGYGFTIQPEWVAALPRGAQRVSLTQRFALPAGTRVATIALGEQEPAVLTGEVQTCEALFITLPGTDLPFTIRPPAIWDADETFADTHGEPAWAHNCGAGAVHRARVEDGVLHLALDLAPAWLQARERVFPLELDPIWTFYRAVGSEVIPSGFSRWTYNGYLWQRGSTNEPFSETTWTGRTGALLNARARFSFSVEGIAAAAASPPGGGSAEYFPVYATRNFAIGEFLRVSDNWGNWPDCSSLPSGTRWHLRTQVNYQDWRCTSGTNASCNFTTQWDAQNNTDMVRLTGTTRWTSTLPTPEWDSVTLICNNCTTRTYNESTTCPGGDAGGTMRTACRAFTPASGNTLTFVGNLGAGDVDHYGLIVPAGRVPRMQFSIRSPGGGCNFDPVLELWFAPNTNGGIPIILDELDDDANGLCPVFQPFGDMPRGGYSIAVRGFSTFDTGPYELTVRFNDTGNADTGFRGFSILGLGSELDPRRNYFGPTDASDLYWSEMLLPDLGGEESNRFNCNSRYVMAFGGHVFRPFASFVPYIEITYIGRVAESPTNLAGRPLSETECQDRGQGEGCGIHWTWNPAAKAEWYNLIDGAGLIPQIRALQHFETSLGENTRQIRRINGENRFAEGPISTPAPAATLIRSPVAGDISLSQPTGTTGRINVTPPVFMGSAAACNGDPSTQNCTAVRYQVRRCNPLQPTCSSNAECGTIAGQPGICSEGQCVAAFGFRYTAQQDFSIDNHACYQVRTRYRNRDGVPSERWSPWVGGTFTTMDPPVMQPPACTDFTQSTIQYRWEDRSVGEEGFRLYPDASSSTSFLTRLTSTSATIGQLYSGSISRVSVAGNIDQTAVGRAYLSVAGFPSESASSNQVTGTTLHRAPYSTELFFPTIRSREVTGIVLGAEARACEGRTGARVERCNASGTGCVVVTNFNLAAPFTGCANRGYGTVLEADGGAVPGFLDGRFIDTGLNPATTYRYRMWYYNVQGCQSSTFTEWTVTTLPEGPCCFDPLDPTNLASTFCVGVCANGSISCSGNFAASCQCNPPSTYGSEVCDALDNDCNGVVDNIVRPASNTLGACSGNTETCTAGAWNPTPGFYVPQGEICNGLDDNCNGQTDEGADGNPLRQACYDGPAGTRDVGICRGGQQTCIAARYGACVGQVLPQPELCNLIDDDCNGTVDDNLADRWCLGGREGCDGPSLVGPTEPRDCVDGCRIGDSVCVGGTLFCDIDGNGGPVLDVETSITNVRQGPGLDTSVCVNAYSDVVCGATAILTASILNVGQAQVPATARLAVYLDWGTATQQLVAGPWPIGQVIPLDQSRSFNFCWLNSVVVTAPQGRTLNAVVFDPADPETCISNTQIGSRTPAQLRSIEPEICDGIDNDCNGIGDFEQSRDACGNSVGDSTMLCRFRELLNRWTCEQE
jgi:hypothetical protein